MFYSLSLKLRLTLHYQLCRCLIGIQVRFCYTRVFTSVQLNCSRYRQRIIHEILERSLGHTIIYFLVIFFPVNLSRKNKIFRILVCTNRSKFDRSTALRCSCSMYLQVFNFFGIRCCCTRKLCFCVFFYLHTFWSRHNSCFPCRKENIIYMVFSFSQKEFYHFQQGVGSTSNNQRNLTSYD